MQTVAATGAPAPPPSSRPATTPGREPRLAHSRSLPALVRSLETYVPGLLSELGIKG